MDFGTLAVHRGESATGMLYLYRGGRPPAEVMADIEALMPVVRFTAAVSAYCRGDGLAAITLHH
jgi:hypothetical protein